MFSILNRHENRLGKSKKAPDFPVPSVGFFYSWLNFSVSLVGRECRAVLVGLEVRRV
ncbi:MAG: hypothetical protein RLZZ458_2033, partial [Planctomycetota bacterium]